MGGGPSTVSCRPLGPQCRGPPGVRTFGEEEMMEERQGNKHAHRIHNAYASTCTDMCIIIEIPAPSTKPV